MNVTTSALVPAVTAALPSLDRFSSYARAIAQIAPLSAAEEKFYVSQWREHQDPDAARALVVGHLYLVVKQVRAHLGYGLSAEDLAQEGALGLMQAVHKFDDRPGVRLGTYAWYWIEARIKEYILRNWRMVNMGVSTLAKKLFFGYRKTLAVLSGEGEQAPSVSEIASSMGVSEKEARMARTYFMGGDVALFDEQDDDSFDEAPRRSLSRLVSQDLEPEDLAITSDRDATALALPALVAALPSRQSQVIVDRYLSEDPRTLSSLALEWDVSIERVRQIEKQAIKALKVSLAETFT